jgi:DNA-directed RNA polymerase specialized sigma subunit
MTAGEQGAIIPTEAMASGAEAVAAEAELGATEPVTYREQLFRQMLDENGNGEGGFYALARGGVGKGNIGDVSEDITRLDPEILEHEHEMELRQAMDRGFEVFITKDPYKDHTAQDKASMAAAANAYGELLYHCQRVVANMARRFAGHVPYADLYQEGNIVVMRALMRTGQLDFGDKIRSHMTHLLQGFMERYVVEESAPGVHVPTSSEAQGWKLAHAREAFLHVHKREPSRKELVRAAGIHDWRFEELRVLQTMRDAEPVDETNERQMAAAGASSEDDPGSEENIDARLIHEMLGVLMVHSRLTTQEKILLSLRVAAHFPSLAGTVHTKFKYPEHADELPPPTFGGFVIRNDLPGIFGITASYEEMRATERAAMTKARRFLQLWFGMPKYLKFADDPGGDVIRRRALATDK